jgi:phosphoesterase RecJ-like protein
MGIPESKLLRENPLINIDHHVDNDNFGSANLVVTSASSTCELVYLLAKRNGFPMEKDAAVAIYVGIVTDTGRFSYSNTTPACLEIAAELIAAGIRPGVIFREVYQSYSTGIARLRALAVLATRFSDDGRLAWSTVTRKMFEETETSLINTQEFSNIPLEVKGVEVAVMFMEVPDDGGIKVSLRAKGNVEVNKVANAFGGGGHRRAAGCFVEESIEDVVEKVLGEVRKHLEKSV